MLSYLPIIAAILQAKCHITCVPVLLKKSVLSRRKLGIIFGVRSIVRIRSGCWIPDAFDLMQEYFNENHAPFHSFELMPVCGHVVEVHVG